MAYVISEAARHPDLLKGLHPERRRAGRRMIAKLQEQIDAGVKAKTMRPVSAEQFFVTLIASCQYPFATQAILGELLGLSPTGLRAFMKRRRTDLPAFLKRALQP
jgi:hypothetical protein